jgi:hypothetical protein
VGFLAAKLLVIAAPQRPAAMALDDVPCGDRAPPVRALSRGMELERNEGREYHPVAAPLLRP